MLRRSSRKEGAIGLMSNEIGGKPCCLKEMQQGCKEREVCFNEKKPKTRREKVQASARVTEIMVSQP